MARPRLKVNKAAWREQLRRMFRLEVTILRPGGFELINLEDIQSRP